MPRLFSSLALSSLVALAGCGSSDGDALFSTDTPPTSTVGGSGGTGVTGATGGHAGTSSAGGNDQGKGGAEAAGTKSGTSGQTSSEGGSAGDGGDPFGGNDPGTGGDAGDAGSDPGAAGDSGGGGDPGAGGDSGDAGSDPFGGGQPQGAGGKPQGAGGQPQGGGGKPQGGGGSPQGGGSGQAGKAGGGTTTGDGVKCLSGDDDTVSSCKGSGKGCCLDSDNPNPCVTSEQCPVGDEQTSFFGFLGCDGPEDCNGGQCCIGQKDYNSQCRPACNADENAMCHQGVGGLLGCTLAGKSCEKISESNFDTGGIYFECR